MIKTAGSLETAPRSRPWRMFLLGFNEPERKKKQGNLSVESGARVIPQLSAIAAKKKKIPLGSLPSSDNAIGGWTRSWSRSA
jgi:hypothetical protein